MVLKKPYAFLIKNFRLIHLILAIPVFYLTYKSMNLVSFFNDYVANDYSLTVNGELTEIFLSPLMYIAVLLIILGSIAVYLLFKYKEKPRNNYIAIIIYYFIFFILLSVSHGILEVMTSETIEASLARSYRDISLLVVLPQYYFCIFTILRGLGFNIKKLNFADDLRELEISEKDDEEFEFVVGVEGYKAKRTFRRFIREFSYYIKENTFIFIIILLMAIIGIGTSIYLNRDKYEVNYKQGEVFGYKVFTVSIEDSIITNLSYNGKVISKDKYYLIIKLNLRNNDIYETLLDYTDFKIKVSDKLIYPIIDKGEYFADYATPYDGKKIKSQEENTYLLVYELTEEQIEDEFELKIYNGVSTEKGALNTRYTNIALEPILINETKEVKTVQLAEKLDLVNSNIGNTNLTINNYQITNKYTYNYERCFNNKCHNYTDYVAVDYFSNGSSTLLVMDYNLLLDKNSAYSRYIKSQKAFFDNFVSIKYKVDDTEFKSSIKNLTPTNIQNVLVLQVNDQIKNADELKLLITIRNKIYIIKLK